jgi:Zn-finger nucleic acid-binding protein
MKCPTCASVDLVMSERQGIEIDYCPTCRGVWLDRGELDKIIERSQLPRAAAPQAAPQGPYAPPPQPVRREEYHGGGDHHDDHHDDHGYGGKHKRKSFLAELFD